MRLLYVCTSYETVICYKTHTHLPILHTHNCTTTHISPSQRRRRRRPMEKFPRLYADIQYLYYTMKEEEKRRTTGKKCLVNKQKMRSFLPPGGPRKENWRRELGFFSKETKKVSRIPSENAKERQRLPFPRPTKRKMGEGGIFSATSKFVKDRSRGVPLPAKRKTHK